MYKKYAVDLSYFNDSIVSALNTHYGEGVTIHYHYGQYLVFSIPAVLDRVIRFNFTGGKVIVHIGDAWTGTSVITNPVDILQAQYASLQLAHLVLGPDFIFFVGYNPTDPFIILFGKMSNGKFFVISTTVNTHVTYSSWRRCVLTENNSTCGFFPMALHVDATHPDDYLIKFPVMIVNSANKILINADGSPATLPGMYFTPVPSDVFNSNQIFIRSGLHCFLNSAQFGNYQTSLLVELTP